MNTKMISTLALAVVALMAVPGTQAAAEDTVIQCRDIEIAEADSAAALNACDVIDVAGGCTTVFASAQVGTTNTYIYRAYNEPVSVANVVSWHLDLTFGTAVNTINYALCVV